MKFPDPGSATAVSPVAEQAPAEADLIARARRDPEAAWRELVRRHQEPAFRLAYLILGDAAEAEDTTQEAFVRAYLKLDTFDAKRPFRPWIMGITANLARNRRRSLGRYWQALQRWWPGREEAGSAASSAAERAEAEMLWQAVRRLNVKGQEVVYLRYFLELSEAETAAALAIPAGTVKSRLHRALQQLEGIIRRDFPQLDRLSDE